MIGPGKYDPVCTYVRNATGAEGAIVIVLDGDQGSGFSVQVPPRYAQVVAGVLRKVADEIAGDTGAVEKLKPILDSDNNN